jgi:hypothetical protein
MTTNAKHPSPSRNPNSRLLFIIAGIALLLSIPWFAMQFTSEVVWTASDFIIMGILLTITGLSIELVLRKVHSLRGRLLIAGAILFLFLLIWAELAVGVFGSPFAGS